MMTTPEEQYRQLIRQLGGGQLTTEERRELAFFTAPIVQGGLFGDDTPSSPRAWTSTARKPVIGTYSATRLCDYRCTDARGHICVCSCGGKNHGKGWITTQED